MLYQNLQELEQQRDLAMIAAMNMNQIKPRLCAKSHGDPLECLDCVPGCPYGERAKVLLDAETKKNAKPISKKDVYVAKQKITAMKNYIEFAAMPDPTDAIMKRFSCTQKEAKAKMYNWRHNYGKNIGMIQSKVREMENELAIAVTSTVDKPEEKPVETKRPSKKQKNKEAYDLLMERRTDLENEFLQNEDKIAAMQKDIQELERKNQTIEGQIKALMAALDVFKEKES